MCMQWAMTGGDRYAGLPPYALGSVEKDIMVFKLSSGKLEDTGQRLKMKGGPAAIRTAEKPF